MSEKRSGSAQTSRGPGCGWSDHVCQGSGDCAHELSPKAERGYFDSYFLRRCWLGVATQGVTDSREQWLAGEAELASDDDGLGVQDVTDVREYAAECAAGGGNDARGGGVTNQLRE